MVINVTDGTATMQGRVRTNVFQQGQLMAAAPNLVCVKD
jgi:hypothetical protein